MTDVRETNLPGVGIRYEFTTGDGRRLGVVHHRTGRRELVVYDRDDPDTVEETVRLNEDESRTLAEMLGGARVADELEKLRQSVEGLVIDWLPVVPETPYVGRTIGDTRARTRTGASIVAVIRDDGTVPAPGPDFKLEAGDTLVVVGTGRGIEDLAVLLRTG
jgi:TrkA domain protein